MKILETIFSLVIVLALSISSAGAEEKKYSELIGKWSVDLRPTPDSAPYYQTFIIDKIEGNSFSGSFYGTPFENGLINTNWDAVYFAFTTADGQSNYHHSGKIAVGKIIGRTHAPGRAMLSIWTAQKSDEK